MRNKMIISRNLVKKKLHLRIRMLNSRLTLKKSRMIDSLSAKRRKEKRFKRPKNLERKCFIKLKKPRPISLLLMMNNSKPQPD